MTAHLHQPILGRGPLVRNLLQHLLKGTWAVVSGGPKLGKTTLLQQVADELLADYRPVHLDLNHCPPPDLSLSVPEGEKPVILLIDNCQSLLPDPAGFLQQAHDLLQVKRGAVRSIVWAGGVEWGEWVLAHRREFNHPVRCYPLGVLTPAETRPILLENLPPASSSEIQRLLELSGGHPYLLKGLLKSQQPDFDDFFFALWHDPAARSEPERALLYGFISADTWIRLEDLGEVTGKKVPKVLLDRLANLGVIIRTLVDGTAAARIVSPLFSEWARRSLPPIAKKQPQLMTTHGHTRQDDYFWLRNRENPEVIEYLKAENAYTESRMAHTQELQEKLFQEMKGRIQETDSSAPVKIDRYYYYVRTEQGKQYPIYCRKRDSLDNKEVIILDQNTLAENKPFLAVGIHEVSPDHALLAYSTDTTGAEKYTLRIKDLITGQLHKEQIANTDYSLEWTNDNKSFFYTILDDARRSYKVLKHVLGTDPEQDVLVYHETDDRFFVNLRKSRSRKYIFMESKSKVTTEVRYWDADSAELAPVLVSPREQEHEYYVDHRGDEFFILTNKSAPNFRLVRTPIASPSVNNWREIVGHREGVTIDSFALFKDYLVLSELANALVKVRIIPLDLKEDHYIEFPEPAYAIDREMNPDFGGVFFRFGYSSFITPQTTFDYNMSTRELHLIKRKEVPGGYNKSEYVIERLYASAPDGTKIPMSLAYKKDLKKEGHNPCWLYGYGSYGAVIRCRFAETRISLMDRGFVFAMAHIRGGGDLGRSGYDAGKYFHKKNTFIDFISCAEHLIREGYTEKEKLSIKGGSAGGLLIGAVLNMRPDLFQSAIASVPFVDVVNTMLDSTLPLTVMEYEEWGNPNDKPYYDYMLAYSPYDNVTKQDYPSLLVTAGLNDPRVQYWEPAKWVAKLRALKTDTHPLLLKTHMEHGHMGSSGRYNFLKEVAFEYAFALDTLGIKE